MNQLLQICPGRPVGAYDNICTHADIGWNITSRVCNGDIGAIVADRMCRSFKRRRDQSLLERICSRSITEREKQNSGVQEFHCIIIYQGEYTQKSPV